MIGIPFTSVWGTKMRLTLGIAALAATFVAASPAAAQTASADGVARGVDVHDSRAQPGREDHVPKEAPGARLDPRHLGGSGRRLARPDPQRELLHVAGALRHQFLIKDGLLRRMGPGGSAWAAGLLALAGGLALMTDWIPEQASWVRETDFPSNYFPGVILMAVVGGSALVAAAAGSPGEVHATDVDGHKALEQVFQYERGLADYVDFLNKRKTPISPVISYEAETGDDAPNPMSLELAMQWQASSYNESVHTFANTINTHEGGTHEEGFRAALTVTANKWAETWGLVRKKEDRLSGEDIREGLTAIVSSSKRPSRDLPGWAFFRVGAGAAAAAGSAAEAASTGAGAAAASGAGAAGSSRPGDWQPSLPQR